MHVHYETVVIHVPFWITALEIGGVIALIAWAVWRDRRRSR